MNVTTCWCTALPHTCLQIVSFNLWDFHTFTIDQVKVNNFCKQNAVTIRQRHVLTRERHIILMFLYLFIAARGLCANGNDT